MPKKHRKPGSLDLPFEEPQERFAQADSSKAKALARHDRLGVEQTLDKLLDALEAIRQSDEEGLDYWSARDLAPLLGYARWENFDATLARAKTSCANVGESVEDHFREAAKMVTIGSGAQRQQVDWELTRFAAYLVALNGDPTKQEIAAAQAYFAVQTRRQELADQTEPELSEDEKRVLLRDEMKAHNKALASAAKAAGVKQPVDYAIFQNEGYKGLYGGLDRLKIQRRKKLTVKQDILDHMPSGELAANLFRATQTEEKLRREGINGKDAANRAHREVGAKVRRTIQEIGGTMPENYPALEHVGEARKRLKGAEPKKLKKS